MRKKVSAISALLVVMAALPAWGLDLKPGRYEITTKVQMAGAPAAIPPQTTTQCITDQHPVPDTSAGAQGCKITAMKTRGNTVTYTMQCEQQGMKTTTVGKITYKGDAFEGTSRTTMGPEAGGMTVTAGVTGKRVGECK